MIRAAPIPIYYSNSTITPGHRNEAHGLVAPHGPLRERVGNADLGRRHRGHARRGGARGGDDGVKWLPPANLPPFLAADDLIVASIVALKSAQMPLLNPRLTLASGCKTLESQASQGWLLAQSLQSLPRCGHRSWLCILCAVRVRLEHFVIHRCAAFLQLL